MPPRRLTRSTNANPEKTPPHPSKLLDDEAVEENNDIVDDDSSSLSELDAAEHQAQSVFINDAVEADGVTPRDEPVEQSSAPPMDVDSVIVNPEDDGEPISGWSASDNQAPSTPSPKKNKTKAKKRGPKSKPLIDTDEDDMYAVGGVKASLLPEPIGTRKTSNLKRPAENSPEAADAARQREQQRSPTKRSKPTLSGRPSSTLVRIKVEPDLGKGKEKATVVSSDSDIEIVDSPSPSKRKQKGQNPLDMERFMADYMEAQGDKMAMAMMGKLMPLLNSTIASSIAHLQPAPALAAEASHAVSVLGPSPMPRPDGPSRDPILQVAHRFSSMSHDHVKSEETDNDDPMTTPPNINKPTFVPSVGQSSSPRNAGVQSVQRDVGDLRSMADDLLNEIADDSDPVVKNEAPPTGAAPVNILEGAVPIDTTVYLEDISSYREHYDPSIPCGVSDPDLQDDKLVKVYALCPGLPGGRALYASFTRDGDHPEDAYVIYSNWPRTVGGLRKTTMGSAMLLVRDGVFINPTRISPADIWMRPVSDGNSSMRVNIGDKVAINVVCGMTLESYLLDPHVSGGANGRSRKYICVVLHSQDHQRWVAWNCLVFGQQYLFTPMTRSGIHFGSVFHNPRTSVSQMTPQRRGEIDQSSSVMLSPMKASKAKAPKAKPQWTSNGNRTKYSYMIDENIPIYDATNVQFDFRSELPELESKLARWTEEVPVGSFVVVGYTASSYTGKAGEKGQQPHIGCNLLWVVVCGTRELHH
ncbi:hypothetical protein C8F04DRAFT_1183236 [Mycena alexandri]|uniref:Uncharacterized protein n=1 Tax=Mycena alexandri TaxID=1745969 RepID=A0AAD6SZ63_9AGAR|nr:hypothetical protein C8F04DRAFT_1183236 [Mycena alexandri]